MDFINLKSLNLTAEESEGLIKFLAQKRGITTKKLLSTIKLNLKRKNNKDLASKSQQKLIKSIKSQQKLAKTQLELLKSQQKLIKSIKTQQKLTKQTKSQRELIKSQRKLKKQQQTRKIRNSFYNIDKKIKPFIHNYDWNDINFPAAKKDWNKFEVNNKNVALNILYVPLNTKKIEIAYKSKYNLIRDNQIILLMISNGKNWHYLAVKSLSRLLRGISSNHNSDYYCLNCFHSYRTENKLNAHRKICENHEYCNIEMPSPNNNLIKYNQREKSLELPFIIYADLECLLKKIDTCQNNPDLSSTTKINQHIPSGYSIYTNCSFDKSNNKLSYYRGEDCMKRFCKDLKDHATKIIDFKKKTMIPLTKEEEDNYNKENICHICKKYFNNDGKVKDHCHFTGKYRGAAYNTCNLRYKIPKNIPVIFHNGSTYDYHFIIKELACEFDGNFECLGENAEKYITFSVPIKKKIENKNIDITYKIKFIDSFRFMATSLSKLVDNLTDNIHNDKCIKCKSNLWFVRAMNEKLIFKCIDCEKEYEKEFNKELI